VKTRLAATLGLHAALRIYRRLAEHAVTEARELAPGVRLRVHHTPAAAREAVAAWLGGDADYLPQHDGDLGQRLADAFAQAFAAGFRRVVVIGSDLPALTADHLRDAFHRLQSTDAVIGPARDGGYWLLGLARPIPDVFSGIDWSTDAVFAQTLRRLADAGIEPARLPELTDVDEAGDLPPGWAEWASSERVAAVEG
jgi:uncharacterized protein